MDRPSPEGLPLTAPKPAARLGRTKLHKILSIFLLNKYDNLRDILLQLIG